MADQREPLSDGDAYDVIHALRQGDSVSDITLVRFAAWASNKSDALDSLRERIKTGAPVCGYCVTWDGDVSVCPKCGRGKVAA
jgi:rubrerythrin